LSQPPATSTVGPVALLSMMPNWPGRKFGVQSTRAEAATAA